MVKYSLAACIARPRDSMGRDYSLEEHLLYVARAMGSPDGAYDDRLRFLAGLLHDAGKALPEWQDYIHRPAGARGPGVPHAFAGAMLFALALERLLAAWSLSRREKERLLHLGLCLVYFIYRHHDTVPDVQGEFPPWQASFSSEKLLALDIDGLGGLVGRFFPERLLPTSGTAGEELREDFRRLAASWSGWRDRMLTYVARIQREGNIYTQSSRLCVRHNLENHRLIAGDRLHAARLEPGAQEGTISISQAASALTRINEFCQGRRDSLRLKGASDALLEKRETCRLEALVLFREQGQTCRVYTLELPTGYGKTLTSLSVALEAVAAGLSRRIIYVAPYISILSQAAAEIAAATGLEVITHHHLSPLEKPAREEVREEDQEGLEVDSWLAPIIATTYNKFFQALFPGRAQHTLRLGGLRDAFVIIDEPQTVAAMSWPVFLTMASALSEEVDCRLLFTTATMPELDGGTMSVRPVSLGRQAPFFSRYQVKYIGQLDEAGLAEQTVAAYHEHGSVAVIMNTIKDAANVYNLVEERLGGEPIYFLSGRLTPLHKQRRIAVVKRALEEHERAIVICTQILEAGVDLSFRRVFRALPVVPSVIQAAGRCNRHGEGVPGGLCLFSFLRGGSEDTRRFVYRDHVQREVTDLIFLGEPGGFPETRAGEVVTAFYHECFRRNTYEASLEKLKLAAGGQWSGLAGLDPFGDDIPTCGIFVPRQEGEMPEHVTRVMAEFHIAHPQELWDLYASRGFLRSLGFTARKRFMALMYQFMVQVPLGVAREIGEPIASRALLRLRYSSIYQENTGLSLVGNEEPYDEQFV